jgi:hypothetical protein
MKLERPYLTWSLVPVVEHLLISKGKAMRIKKKKKISRLIGLREREKKQGELRLCCNSSQRGRADTEEVSYADTEGKFSSNKKQ